MKRKIFFSIMLLLVVLLVVYALQTVPHRFSKAECPSCHATGPSGEILEHELTEPVSMICRRCHEKLFEEGYMHPCNVRPAKVFIPEDMPLSPSGEVTCVTCHDIHASYFTPYDAPSHFLRRCEGGRQFCEICHLSSPLMDHQSALVEAHFRSKFIVTDPSGTLDAVSQNCLSCHDGSFARSVGGGGAGIWTHKRELMRFDGGSHPIGVDYENARSSNRNAWLKPIVLVDDRIRFFSGKVGCGSCHDPYSTIENRLVMSDRRSRLCLSCHEMDRG